MSVCWISQRALKVYLIWFLCDRDRQKQQTLCLLSLGIREKCLIITFQNTESKLVPLNLSGIPAAESLGPRRVTNSSKSTWPSPKKQTVKYQMHSSTTSSSSVLALEYETGTEMDRNRIFFCQGCVLLTTEQRMPASELNLK